MHNILKKICEDKRIEIEILKKKCSLNSLKKLISDQINKRDFKNIVINSSLKKKNYIIGEIKKASPSAGEIIHNYEPVDFIIDEYQIYESKVYQADVILLIVSVLSDDELKKFLKIANELNLDCIIETHDENEIKRALKLDYPILGINNRNLKNLKTDLNNSVSLFTSISKDYTVIAESGIKTAEDISMYNDLGIFNFLIGESILRSKDYATFIKKLLNHG
jgi:indole-3-glycerol phosphate synthase